MSRNCLILTNNAIIDKELGKDIGSIYSQLKESQSRIHIDKRLEGGTFAVFLPLNPQFEVQWNNVTVVGRVTQLPSP